MERQNATQQYQQRYTEKWIDIYKVLYEQEFEDEVISAFNRTLRTSLNHLFAAIEVLSSNVKIVKNEDYTRTGKAMTIASKFARAVHPICELAHIPAEVASFLKHIAGEIEIGELFEEFVPEKAHAFFDHLYERFIGPSEGKKLQRISALFSSGFDRDIFIAQTTLLLTRKYSESIKHCELSVEASKKLANRISYRVFYFLRCDPQVDINGSVAEHIAYAVSIYGLPEIAENVPKSNSKIGTNNKKFTIRENDILSLSGIKFIDEEIITTYIHPTKSKHTNTGFRLVRRREKEVLIEMNDGAHMWKEHTKERTTSQSLPAIKQSPNSNNTSTRSYQASSSAPSQIPLRSDPETNVVTRDQFEAMGRTVSKMQQQIDSLTGEDEIQDYGNVAMVKSSAQRGPDRAQGVHAQQRLMSENHARLNIHAGEISSIREQLGMAPLAQQSGDDDQREELLELPDESMRPS